MFRSLVSVTYRQARRLVIFITGAALLIVGVALIFLPGPAIIVIPAGLAVLSLEFAWARRFLQHVRRRISEQQRQMRLKNGMGKRDG
jgi:tellurite resistance protein TerC